MIWWLIGCSVGWKMWRYWFPPLAVLLLLGTGAQAGTNSVEVTYRQGTLSSGAEHWYPTNQTAWSETGQTVSLGIAQYKEDPTWWGGSFGQSDGTGYRLVAVYVKASATQRYVLLQIGDTFLPAIYSERGSNTSATVFDRDGPPPGGVYFEALFGGIAGQCAVRIFLEGTIDPIPTDGNPTTRPTTVPTSMPSGISIGTIDPPDAGTNTWAADATAAIQAAITNRPSIQLPVWMTGLATLLDPGNVPSAIQTLCPLEGVSAARIAPMYNTFRSDYMGSSAYPIVAAVCTIGIFLGFIKWTWHWFKWSLGIGG